MRSNRDPVLSVVVPVYNERATLKRILRRVVETPRDKEIIIVDDASNDGTRDIVAAIATDWASVLDVSDAAIRERTNVKVVMQTGNFGKGAAIAAGFKKVSGDVVVIQDADLEYDPADYEKLLEPILTGAADVVYGSRFAGETRCVLHFWHALGNRLLTLASNVATNLNLTDMETCYKMFRAELLERFTIDSKRFGIEPEITAKFARMKARIYEVPVVYAARTSVAGKKIGWKDAVSAVWTILKYAVVADVVDSSARELRRGPLRGSLSHNRWVWSMIEPHVGDSILEVGAGSGGLTRFLADRASLTVTDPDESNIEKLCDAFVFHPHVSIERMSVEGEPSPGLLMREFDTVVSANALNSITDDLPVLRRMNALLKRGGRLLLLVPATHAVFASALRLAGKNGCRDKASMQAKLRKAGFDVDAIEYLSPIGALAWYLGSSLLARKAPAVAERVLNNIPVPSGTYLLVTATRPGAAVQGEGSVTKANLESSMGELRALQARSGGPKGNGRTRPRKSSPAQDKEVPVA